MYTLRRLALILMILWLLVMACNLPTAPSARGDPAFRKTLDALSTPTRPGLPPANPTATPAAGQPPAGATEQPPIQPTIIPGRSGHGVLIPGAPVRVDGHFQYATQPGDTLTALAGRFSVSPEQILDPQQIPPNALLSIGHLLTIPDTLGEIVFVRALLPDSEIVYSPSTVDFSVSGLVLQAGGYLSTYSEKVDDETLTGAQIVQRVAEETSTNPRILLAVLEYRSHWVYGRPAEPTNTSFPIGFNVSQYSGLYKELILVSRQLTLGYYGWRYGKVVDIEFTDRTKVRMSPTINAGTMALAYLFSKLYPRGDWSQELYNPGSFLIFYQELFGDPWQRAAQVEPLLPDDITQPELELPFQPGISWSFTGGPHANWGVGSPWGGLDFAPANVEKGCTVSRFWTTASASGLVVRSENGVVIVDLDGDGHEQTGWVLLYLHVAEKDRVAVGTYLNINDQVGHPSCEGGFSTGTHVHLARKYNGEWLAADSPVPFVLSGWRAWPGSRQYSGSLVKGDQVVNARPDSPRTSIIAR